MKNERISGVYIISFNLYGIFHGMSDINSMIFFASNRYLVYNISESCFACDSWELYLKMPMP